MTRVAGPSRARATRSLALFSFFGAESIPLATCRDERQQPSDGANRAAAAQAANSSTGSTSRSRDDPGRLPLFVLLLVFQKQLVRGLTAGRVKDECDATTARPNARRRHCDCRRARGVQWRVEATRAGAPAPARRRATSRAARPRARTRRRAPSHHDVHCDDARAEDTLRRLTNQFNSSQNKVH